jgi:(p)ppGpp synthase/HD superfamily hydrolase
MSYAQTNVQLYNQLRGAAWADDDLRHVQAAYQLAMRVVAGHYRPNEKPELAHLVGVASILAACGAPSTLVSAGLLHGVYHQGEFGDGSRGASEEKRREVRRAVGAACEELVARYAAFPWTAASLETFAASAAGLPAVDAAVALMKLADTLEDHHELGIEYSTVKSSTLKPAHHEWLQATVKLARAMGQEVLAAELAAALSAGGRPVPECLQTLHRGSFALAPMSHGVRTSVRLGKLYRLMRDRVLPAARIEKRAA